MRSHYDLSLAELMDDPMTSVIMAADRVDRIAVEKMFEAVTARLSERAIQQRRSSEARTVRYRDLPSACCGAQ